MPTQRGGFFVISHSQKTLTNGATCAPGSPPANHAKICNKGLTSLLGGLALNYHLRSNSGSNGPIAKECHRFLVAGPFKLGPVWLFRLMLQSAQSKSESYLKR